MIEKLQRILLKEGERLASLRGIDRRKLKEVTNEVDVVLEKINNWHDYN